MGLELMNSSLVKNSIVAVAENKPLQYSTTEGWVDCLNIGKALFDDLNKYHNLK